MRRKENGSGQPVNNLVNSIVEKIEKRSIKDRNTRKDMNFRRSKNIGPRNSSTRHKDGNKERKPLEDNDISVVHGKMERKTKKGGDNQVKEEKIAKGSKRNKPDSPEIQFRIKLDMCSKKGDVMGAIQLYDLGQKEGIKMEQYHYTVLLYLCSSAAVGIVQPAKSGSGGRVLTAEVSSGDNSLRKVELSELRDKSDRGATESESLQLDQKGYNSENHDAREIQVSEDIKKYALERGFEIYEKMCMDKVPMNEATLTAVARMAMSMGNADMAFDMVKQMTPLGLNPRLRSYGPALYAFCNNGDVDKAFAVEKHMLEHGVYPEEPELEALLKVSVQAGKGDKVYNILHKLRTSVRKVSPSTAEIIVGWFKSKAASRVGKTKWDKRVIEKAIENGGGGWHGQGWLGKGKWTVSVTSVGSDASCKSCGEKLVTIDLDPIETDNFAESVASIAIKRDKDSSFQKFQKWLDYYGPFEAVIDGANVGLLSQKRFVPSKINAIANGIRQKLPSKRWPLIVLHNRRITGPKMDEPVNKALVEKWKNADALYATPTGSNDDWYWLYAAIKFRCLIVTNDEMRDHTFQLLGNDFFPKWKERHQVHFNFSEAGPIFHMPPCFSVVIQESEKGHWHIPIATDHDYEPERAWLCITRAKSFVTTQDSTPTRHEDSQSVEQSNGQSRVKLNQDTLKHSSQEDLQKSPQEVYKNLTNILSASGFSDHNTVLSKIEAAEKFGDCVIDFQI
ncbi:proteinaceous RNase P 1, chloroplastic/mitochondrial isoform X2 [Jatropha curcas]|nr:proteinaceous RNase P 1, chloroplastic/mitochondrial isoform X2 [Jatropha curcas]